MITILDLPNELIIDVAKLLATEDLLHAILWSRRLHCLIIPILLFRYNFRLPADEKVFRLVEPDVPALNLWQHSLLFKCPQTIDISMSVGDALKCMRLARFFSSLQGPSSPQTIKLHIDDIPNPRFSMVLDALRSTNVTNLTLSHPSSTLCKMVLPSHVGRRALAFAGLKVFRVHAAVLFDAPFARWTLQSINASQITELSLQTPGIFAPSWSRVLERLDVPTLRVLRVEGELSQTVLHRFLLKHRGLEELYVGYHSDYRTQFQLRAPPPSLPALSVLSAPVPYLLRLLSNSRSQFTSLVELTIFPDYHHEDPLHFASSLHRILAAVVDCKNLSALTCMIPPSLARSEDNALYGGFSLCDSGLRFPEVGYIVLQQVSREWAPREKAFDSALLVRATLPPCVLYSMSYGRRTSRNGSSNSPRYFRSSYGRMLPLNGAKTWRVSAQSAPLFSTCLYILVVLNYTGG